MVDDVVFHAKGPKKKTPQPVYRKDDEEDIVAMRNIYSTPDIGYVLSVRNIQIDEPQSLERLHRVSEAALKRLWKTSAEAQRLLRGAFILALLLGHVQMCRALQRVGLNPRNLVVTPQDLNLPQASNFTPAILAAVSGKVPAMEYVFSLNLPVSTPDHNLGLTAAHVAAVTGDIPMLKLLRERVSLSSAVGGCSLVYTLITRFQLPHVPTRGYGSMFEDDVLRVMYPRPRNASLSVFLSPLMAAVLGKQLGVFDYLIDVVQVDVGVTEKHKNTTAAHICALASRLWEPAATHCLLRLISRNAEMDCVDSYGRTVFDYVPSAMRSIVEEEFCKHTKQAMQTVLKALEPSTIPVGPLMNIVVSYLNLRHIDWGPAPAYS